MERRVWGEPPLRHFQLHTNVEREAVDHIQQEKLRGCLYLL